MKVIIKVANAIYIFWVFLVFTVFMLLFLPGLTLPFLFGSRVSWIGYSFLWIWSWVFSFLTRIRYEFHGRENFRKGQSYIFVSNHTSFLDLPGIRLLIPGEFRPLAKKELLKIPVFGLIARGATIIVDRSDRESKQKSLERLKEILREGISILLFAEGTQNRTKEILQPFKDGAFRLAIDTQMPILPMVVIGAGKLMPPGTINMRPGLIKIIVGSEIPTEGITDAAELKKQTFDVMKEMIVKNSPS
ncbi:MAG: lysophospholipid acyltransferase family protein [Cyclobacteriaceae bacterium]